MSESPSMAGLPGPTPSLIGSVADNPGVWLRLLVASRLIVRIGR
jgi:hypothetical protein